MLNPKQETANYRSGRALVTIEKNKVMVSLKGRRRDGVEKHGQRRRRRVESNSHTNVVRGRQSCDVENVVEENRSRYNTCKDIYDH